MLINNSSPVPLLDIIVPHYKEPWSIGKKFFFMLDLQRGINFSDIRVIIVNDGEENELPAGLLHHPYQVIQVSIPHGGVGAARNKGIDLITAKWVKFCDFDDMFIDVYALHDILALLSTSDKDVLIHDYKVEMYNLDHELTTRVQSEPNVSMVHGFIINSEFLIKSGIRFDTEFKYEEDYDFMFRLTLETEPSNIGKMHTSCVPYTYCLNMQSVTADPDSFDEKMKGLFRRMQKQSEAYKKKGFDNDYARTVVSAAYTMYHVLNVLNPSDKLVLLQKEFSKWYKNHSEAMKNVSENYKFEAWNHAKQWTDRMEACNKVEWMKYRIPVFDKDRSFEQWLDDISKLEEA